MDAAEKIINKKKDEETDYINENVLLKNTINVLKNEINELKQNNNNINNDKNNDKNINKDNEDAIIQLNEKILEKDMIIEELSEEYNKLDQNFKLYTKEIISLQNYISKLEKNMGVDEEINNLKSIINEKEKMLIDFSEQIKEYQSQCDDIIIGNSIEEKDEQIKMLLNEVKAIRSRLQNMITFEGRITDFDEFLVIINNIKNYISKSDDKDIQQCYEQLNILVEDYELNGQKYYNKLIQEIFGINYCEEDDAEYNNEIGNDNDNEEQNYIDNINNNENFENNDNFENDNNNNEINYNDNNYEEGNDDNEF